MSRVVYYCAATLDGYVAEADDTIGWLTGYRGTYAGPDAEPMEGAYDRFYETVGSLVMGSATYEFVREATAGGDWPYAGKPCWVLTSRALPVPAAEGADVRFARGEVAALHEELVTAAGDRDVWVVGGGSVASQLAEARLLDELRVHVVPVVLGGGKQLFERRLPGGPLRLAGVVPRDNGMVELTYALDRAA